MRTRRARRALILAASVVAMVGGALRPAEASGSDEARLFSLANQLRASVGAPPLALDAGVSAVARSWASRMAASGSISHNPGRSSQISGWLKLGENVGMAGTVDAVHQLFVTSAGHYGNLVDPAFNVVGIGVVASGGRVFVVEDFVKTGAAAAPAPAPAVQRRAPAPAPPPRRPAARPPAPKPSAPTPPVPPPEPEPVRPPELTQTSYVLEQLRALDLRRQTALS